MISISRLTRSMRIEHKTPILMITPPSVFLLDERVFMSLGILKVAAVLEQAKHKIELLDLSGIENYEEVVDEYVHNTKAVVVALTTTTPQLPAAVKIAQKIRLIRPDIRIIIGGPHITLVNSAVKLEKKHGRIGRAHHALDALYKYFDVLVSGDGEFAIFNALVPDSPKLIDGDDHNSDLFMDNASYDASPYPARHLVDVNSYNYTIDGFRATSLIAQLGCPFGCHFCLTGDTFIFTDCGFERLDSLVSDVQNIEKCIHGNHAYVSPLNKTVATIGGSAIAEAIVYTGKKSVIEVCASYGYKVRGTGDHPVLSVQDRKTIWKNIKDLHIGDWLVVRNPEYNWPSSYVSLESASFRSIPPGGFQRKKFLVPSILNEDIAWLTGFLIGDGCLPADGRPSVHVCVTDSVREKLTRVIWDNFGAKLSIRPSSHTDKMQHGWIHSRAVYEFFVQSMGISPKNKLHVPPIIIRSPKSVVKAFIDGLWDADAYGVQGYLTTISSDLAREVSQLLLMLGDFPSINKINSKEGHKDQYRINRMKFDRIPTDKAIYKSNKSGKWFWRTPRNPKTFLGVKRTTLRKSGLFHPLDQDGYHYVQVQSIIPGIIEPVYDLRVPGDHNFIANGIVTHNCGGRNSKSLRMIRTRTTQSIISEIEMLHKTYGFTGFMFYDDELNVSKSIIELMDEIAKLQLRLHTEFRLRGFVKAELFTDEQAASMYKAGFRWILCGFESASPKILDNINKRATVEDNTRVIEIARRHNLKVKALMSVGHPGEDEQSITSVRDWLISVKPDDFDCTVITTYAGTPYYDEAIPHESMPNVWTYTCKKSGDRLHAYDVDYVKVADYYKGDPNGGYHSYVFTDYLSGDEIVRLRNKLENEVRVILNIPFNPGKPGTKYEHSMGQGPLPAHILRESSMRLPP